MSQARTLAESGSEAGSTAGFPLLALFALCFVFLLASVLLFGFELFLLVVLLTFVFLAVISANSMVTLSAVSRKANLGAVIVQHIFTCPSVVFGLEVSLGTFQLLPRRLT